MSFDSISKDVFVSRGDPRDPRLGDLAQAASSVPSTSVAPCSIAILGYPDDEGIRLNGGRPGAAEAPDRIRRFLYKMTPSSLSSEPLNLYDFGNLKTASHSLEKRHEIAEKRVRDLQKAGFRWLSFGGGHDYGFPDAAAFVEECRSRNEDPLVLNFDAHLDVRPTDRGLTSGTPFFRLLEKFEDLDFAEIGIQAHCNALAHRQWALEKGARIMNFEEIGASRLGLDVFVLRHLDDWLLRPRPAFLSIDIDGFSNSFAPGCSQSWATGFDVDGFLRLFQILLARLDVRGVGIYEVSPPLDEDDRTAKLAALLAHRFIYPL